MDPGPVETVDTISPRSRRRPKAPSAGTRRVALGEVDGRLRGSRFMRQLIRELTTHCGGHPSAVQRRIIQRAAVLHLHLALLDAKTGPDGSMSEAIARQYLAWNNAYVRTLNALGLKAAKPTASLTDYLAVRHADAQQRPAAP